MVMSALLFMNETKAQVRFNVNVNIGARPNWGLAGNYAGDYYYLPEIDTYYDIPHRQFIYLDGGNWIFASELPYMYRDYDLYRGFKVVVNEPRPYLNCNVYRSRYSNYYNTYRRPVIIDQRQASTYGRFDNDRYTPGRNDRYYDARRGNEHFDRNDRNDRYDRDHNDRDDHHDRGRGNERGRDNDRGGNHRGRE